jgi:hypothetical protein
LGVEISALLVLLRKRNFVHLAISKSEWLLIEDVLDLIDHVILEFLDDEGGELAVDHDPFLVCGELVPVLVNETSTENTLKVGVVYNLLVFHFVF